MTDHDVSLLAIPRDHSRRPGWVAACEPCGWCGDERDNAPTAVHDAADHLKLNAPRGKE